MMVIDNKYNIGDFVYLNTDTEQKKRLVISISVSPTGIRYCLSCGNNDTWHYDIEISKEIDVLAKVE